ncbi:MAG: hypothetical protein AAFY29_07735 [Pseudomonadota bacterium]
MSDTADEHRPTRRRAMFWHAFDRSARTLESSRSALGERGAESFVMAVAAPLIGLAVMLIAGLLYAQRAASQRFLIGVIAAAVALAALATLQRHGLGRSRNHTLHLGGALALLGLALVCNEAALAYAGVVLLLTAVTIAAATDRIRQASVLVPAVFAPLALASLHPHLSLLVPALLSLGLAAGLLLRRRPVAAGGLLAAPLALLHGGAGGDGWLAVALAGVIVTAALRHREFGALRSDLSLFAVDAVVLLYLLDALDLCGLELVSAAWTSAALALAALALESRFRQGIDAPGIACAALLAAFAVAADDAANDSLALAAALLAIGGALQLAALWLRNVFASNIALGLVLLGAVGPLVEAAGLFGLVRRSTAPLPLYTVAVGLTAAAMLSLFARRVSWKVSEPWWHGLVLPRTAVQVRRLLRHGRKAITDIPLLGPIILVFQRAVRVFTGFLRHEYQLGLPELVVVGAQLYVLTLLGAWLESAALQAGLSVASERALIAGLWSAAGVLVFVLGRFRQRPYLRLAGLVYAMTSLALAGLEPAAAGFELMVLLGGAALSVIGVLSLGAVLAGNRGQGRKP